LGGVGVYRASLRFLGLYTAVNSSPINGRSIPSN
jgi:hypothetical protein